MAKALTIEELLKNGSAEWNRLRKSGQVGTAHTGATFAQLFSANADLSGLDLVGSEWEKCDLSKMNFRETDLSNAYFHGGRLQDCDFRGANLEGATFEKLKLLRCDFTGAKGLEEVEFDEVDMDRVAGLGDEVAPPPPPPPVHSVTSFTREQRTAQLDGEERGEGLELPPFRPQDPPGALLARGLKSLESVPVWTLDIPGLRVASEVAPVPGTSLESLAREVTRLRLEGTKPEAHADAVKRAQTALRLGSKEAAFAAVYLRETEAAPLFRFSSAKSLRSALKAEMDVNDLTGSVDPRTTAALLALRLTHESEEALGEVRRRLAATQLFSALLEAGFTPENNWEEAVDSLEPAQDLAQLASAGDRAALAEAFSSFFALPLEARLRRLGYLAEASNQLQALSRLPEGTEPRWLSDPEARECHDREMELVETLKAEEVPQKVAALAAQELGIPEGTVPMESEDDLFIHLRCPVCGKEKLLVQSPE